MNNKVHISGCGVMSPLGLTLEDHLNFLKSEDSLELTGKIPEFRSRDYIKDRKALKVMSRQVLLGCITAKQAIENSGYAGADDESNPDGNGVIWGAPVSNSFTSMKDVIADSSDETGELDFEKLGDTGYRQVPPLWIIPKLPNTTAGQISIQNQFKGINYSIVNGANNGFVSIGEAFESIRHGESERILCGASEEESCGDFIHKLYSVGVASVSSDSDGVSLSEAGVSFQLEEGAALEKRSGESHCSITGYGNSYVPDYDSISEEILSDYYVEVMKSTVEDAGLELKDIDFIQATCCGISKIDRAEALAVKKLFGRDAYITSVTPAAGYSLTASGPLSLITAMIQLKYGFLSPVKGSGELFFKDELNYVEEVVNRKCSRALCNSFDYFGSACSMVLEN